MARFGVFNRNDNSVTPVSRSLQEFDHSMSTTLPYGQITPIFYEEMLPNERLSVNVTNLVRSIPMVSPMLSRVKVITRFYAVPKRILWLGFEEYIDGVKDSQFVLTEPFIANFNQIVQAKYDDSMTGGTEYRLVNENRFEDKSSLVSWAATNMAELHDLSAVGIGYDCVKEDPDAEATWAHQFKTLYRGVSIVDNKFKRTDLMGYQFFPHELGDYFNAPLYMASLASDKSGRFSAYPFAAYQLCYSYGYRQPNVQDRVDDFFQMSKANINDHLYNEFPAFYTFFWGKWTTWPATVIENNSLPSYALSRKNHVSGTSEASKETVYGNTITQDGSDYSTDKALATDSDSVLRTSWSNVEHFPLRGGANAVMQALNWTDGGTPDLTESLISLTRLRYANWQSDRFNEANPWQQRGEEAQIPVVGTADIQIAGLQFRGTPASISIVPVGEVDSTFSGGSSSFFGNIFAPSQLAGNNLVMQNKLTDPVDAGGNIDIDQFRLRFHNNADEGTVSMVGNLYTEGNTSPATGSVSSIFRGSLSSANYTPAGIISSSGATTTIQGLYVSPSSFRFAMQLQKIKEMSARTDGRFKSFLSMFYGARSRDARLDRPEFIGGSVQILNINEVEQTSETANTPLGTLGGRGFSAKRSHTFDYRASEHTCIIGLVHIVPDSEYIGGLERTRHLTSPFDTAMPQFAGLSEQPIRMAELAFRPSSLENLNQDLNDTTFGFEPRYNELRVKHSYATGAFRDYWNTTGSYKYYKPWLITRQFGYKPKPHIYTYYGTANAYYARLDYEVPTLSDEFLSMRDTVDYSNFEVTDPQIMMPFMLDSFFNVRWVRVIPSRGIPRI